MTKKKNSRSIFCKRLISNFGTTPNSIITKEDIDALVPKGKMFRDVVEKVCRERIDYCDNRVKC